MTPRRRLWNAPRRLTAATTAGASLEADSARNPDARREDPRAVGRDRDRVLEVGGHRAVLRANRPAVVHHEDVRLTGRDHRLDRDRHALGQARAAAGLAEVRDVRILV